MAELILKIGAIAPDPAYQDGDIINAVNDIWIRRVHAQHVCHKDKIGFNSDGLRPSNSLTEMYLAGVKQYKFERISKFKIRRIDLWLGTKEILSNKPNAKGEYIDVVEYLRRRKRHTKHITFGTTDNEVWYGGRTRVTASALNDVWAEIEIRTAYKKAEHSEFPWGTKDQVAHLVITVDDFDNDTRLELESSVMDNKQDPPTLLKKRRHKVVWRNLPGLTQQIIDDILTVDTYQGEELIDGKMVPIWDGGVKVDIRKDFSFTRSQIVEAKSTATGL